MRFADFLLDHWLNEFDAVPCNLAASTGPPMSLADLAGLTGADVERLLSVPLVYTPTGGHPPLRGVVAARHEAEPEDVQILTGASEALVILFALAAEPGANIVLPSPGYPAMRVLAGAFGLEARHYGLDREHGFAIDPDEVASLMDERSRLVVVNSPHNPTGACVSDEVMGALYARCDLTGVPLVSDEVYHPLYFEDPYPSAACFPDAIVVGSCSKVYALSGVRVGWIVDRNPERRTRYWNARAALSISNTATGEAIAEIALRHADAILQRTHQAAEDNLRRLDAFLAARAERFGWVRPQGGTVAFPWLLSNRDTRPWCRSLAEDGVLLAPGDCFEMPAHFRVGFGGDPARFADGLARISRSVAI